MGGSLRMSPYRRRLVIFQGAPTPVVPTIGGPWAQNLKTTTLTKPTPLRTVDSTSWADFKTDIANALDGDEIRFINDITTSGSYTIDGAGGSVGAPVVINMNGYALRCGEASRNPATQANGASSPFHHINCNHLWYWQPHWDGNRAATWGPTFGGRYQNDPTNGPCSHITVADALSENAWQQGMKFSRNSHHITLDAVEIRNWACQEFLAGASDNRGIGSSGLYLGEGGQSAWAVNDVDIHRLWIHDIGFAGSGVEHSGMAINFKYHGYNLAIRELLIENLSTRSQGALNLNADRTRTGSNPANMLVEDFVIRGVRRTAGQFGGQGVTFGADGTVRRGVVYDTDSWGVQFTDSFDPSYLNAFLDQVTVFDTGKLFGGARGITDVSSEYDDVGGQGDGTTPNHSITNCIAPNGGQFIAAAGDFVGPTTGTADAGSGTGSGFQLASSSSIPATAGALGKAA